MMTTAPISTRQNEPRELLRLRAQRRLYGKSAWLGISTAIAAIVLAIFGPVLADYDASLNSWIALTGIAFAAVEVLWLRPLERRWRQRAAAVHELFDCHVLGLPWNPLAVEEVPVEVPVDETVAAGGEGETALTARADDKLRNWYSPEVDAVPEPAACLICQRSNVWWDSEQRRPYAVALLALAVSVPLVFTGWSIGNGSTVDDYLVGLAAALPLVLWAGQEARKHNEAADRVQRLRNCAEELWKNLITDSGAETRFPAESRSLQDQIYLHRRESPKVPDWFYRAARKKRERQLTAAVSEMVRQYPRWRLGR